MRRGMDTLIRKSRAVLQTVGVVDTAKETYSFTLPAQEFVCPQHREVKKLLKAHVGEAKRISTKSGTKANVGLGIFLLVDALIYHELQRNLDTDRSATA